MPPRAVETPQSLKEFIGKEIGASDWFAVTQERIDRFAEATEDRQWIHVDRERAKKESPYRTTVAHGFLTLSLISHLSKQAMEIRGGIRLAINYGLNRVRFPAPVREGSRVRAHYVLVSLKELEKGHEATIGVTVECEGSEKPCCVAEWVVRYYT
jgi:acyl dehydratase